MTSAKKAAIPGDVPTIIAVMGATGTGKSTFINLVSGTELYVGDGLRLCTAEVSEFMFELDGRKVVLIDTPGFDDTTRSDTDILKAISSHLSQKYEMGVFLSGVIYMHQITDLRMGGVNCRNFAMFRKLCGEETLRNVLIVTNMWGLLTNLAMGEKREHELKTDDKLFKPMLDKGARMIRHDGMLESAQVIVRKITKNHAETSAREELSRELLKLMEKHKTEMAELKEEMDEALRAKDGRARKELRMVEASLMERLKQAEQDRDRLFREYAQDKKRADKKLRELNARLLEEMQERQKRDVEFDDLHAKFRESQRRGAKDREAMLTRIYELEQQRKAGWSYLIQ